MSFTFSDNFNRADSTTTLGASWSVLSGGDPTLGAPTHPPVWGIDTNRAYVVTGYTDTGSHATDSIAYVDAGPNNSDFDISVTYAALDTQNLSGLIFRMAAGGASFFAFTRQDHYFQVNMHNVTTSSLSVATGTFVAGDVMRVTGVGSLLSFYRNGTLLGTATDARNVAETRFGIMGNKSFNPATRFDNFSLTASPPVRPKLWAVGAIRLPSAGSGGAISKQLTSDIVMGTATNSTTVTFPSTVAAGSVVALCYIRQPGSGFNGLACSGLGATWANIETAIGAADSFAYAGIWYGVTTSAGTTVTMTCAGAGGMYTMSEAYAYNGGSPVSVGTALQETSPTAVAATPAITCNAGDVVVMSALVRGGNSLSGTNPVVYTDSPAAWTTLRPFVRLGAGYQGNFASYLISAQRSVATDGESVSRQVSVTSSAGDASSQVAAIRIIA